MLDKECCRWERYRYAAYTRFKEPKLYRLVVSGDWDEIPQRARTHPKEAQFKHSYAPMDMALHRLLRAPMTASDEETQSTIAKIKLDAVSALLRANPNACVVQDAFGRTPLHLACMDIESGGLTAYLVIKTSPQAVSVLDLDGRTPLHYLVARNEKIPLCVLSMLIEIYPDASTTADSTKETPLDIASQRANEIEDAEKVLQLLKGDAAGKTPSDKCKELSAEMSALTAAAESTMNDQTTKQDDESSQAKAG